MLTFRALFIWRLPLLTRIPGSFLGMELSVFVIFAWGLTSAVRRSRQDVMTLVVACLFGFMVEYLFATANLPAWLKDMMASDPGSCNSGNYYRYEQPFLIMVAGVPLWVSLGWGSIIYAATRTSSSLGFPLLLAPLADGLLAASVDFALDPMAAGLGYWKWFMPDPQPPGLGTAFGIPLDNFLGWMMIVGSLSLTLRLGYRLAAKLGASLWLELGCAAVAFVGAVAIVVGMQAVYNWLYCRVTPAGTFLLVFGAAGLATLSRLPWLRRDAPLDPWTLTLIAFMHVYCFVMSATHDVYKAHPALIAFAPLLCVWSWLAYAWPSLSALGLAWSNVLQRKPVLT